jgi:hypothetical protein
MADLNKGQIHRLLIIIVGIPNPIGVVIPEPVFIPWGGGSTDDGIRGCDGMVVGSVPSWFFAVCMRRAGQEMSLLRYNSVGSLP